MAGTTHKSKRAWYASSTGKVGSYQPVPSNIMMFAIYHDNGYSGKRYCIKKWNCKRVPVELVEDYHFESDDLEACRAEMVRMGLFKLAPMTDDDPSLIETWF